MRPTTRELIEAIVVALEQQVTPAVADKWAASALRSAVQLLNHIALRVENEGRVLIEDNADIRRVLTGIAPVLADRSELGPLLDAISRSLAGSEPPPYDAARLSECNEEYQAAVELLLRNREALNQATGTSEWHDALRAYLARRLDREQQLYFPVFTTGPPF
jgi:hypothetical protein